ncbi:MAG: hypothetical protein RPT25_13955 [Cycloclasticus sp.]
MQLSPEQIELSSKLTALQRKYVINLVGGDLSQRQAYVAAGGKAKTESAQDAAASTMLSNIKVKKFYDSLINQSASLAVLTRQQALEILTTNANKASECRDQHAAIKQLSDMQGWNAPKETKLSGEIALSEVVRKVID